MPALTKQHKSQSIKHVLCEICLFTSYGINSAVGCDAGGMSNL
jgi:hypothetical protein